MQRIIRCRFFPNAHATLLSLLVVGALLTFMPVICGLFPVTVELRAYNADSLRVVWSSVATLALLVPLGTDLFFDLMENISSIFPLSDVEQLRFRKDKDFLYTSEAALILIGLALPPIVTLAGASSDNEYHHPEFNSCARVCRLLLVLGAFGCTLSRIDNKTWSPVLFTFTLISFVASQVLKAFILACVASGNPAANALYILHMVTAVVAIVLFYSVCAYWLYRNVLPRALWLHRIQDDATATQSQRESAHRESKHESVGSSRSNVSVGFSVKSGESTLHGGENVPAVSYDQLFVSLVIICITIVFLISLAEKNNQSDAIGSSITDVAYIVVEILLLVLTMRKAKSEAILGVVSHRNALNHNQSITSHDH
jgi:hypothetical protein